MINCQICQENNVHRSHEIILFRDLTTFENEHIINQLKSLIHFLNIILYFILNQPTT